jgi:Bacterial Ig-like domain (group 3)/FG-GAP-like repeat/FG-GAP repeat
MRRLLALPTIIVAGLLIHAAPRGLAASEFQSPIFTKVITNPSAVALGDFNGDGNLDVVVAGGQCSRNPCNALSVLLGNGDGSFRAPVTYAGGMQADAVVAADVNGDGHADLVVADYGGGGTISVLLGNPDGTFQAPTLFAVGNEVTAIAVGDLNGDGNPDIVEANSVDNNIGVLFGNGDGTFQTPVRIATGHEPQGVAIGDFNGDSIPDLAVANHGDLNVEIFVGKGSGSFKKPVSYPVSEGSPGSVLVGDFDGDGKLDLAIGTTGDVAVLLGKGDGTFGAASMYAGGSDPLFVAAGDVNGDGYADLIAANADASTVSVLPGNGNGTFQSPESYSAGFAATGVAVGDLNGDGAPDLVAPALFEGEVAFLFNGGGTHIATSSAPNPSDEGQKVVLRASLRATYSSEGTPTGSVIFSDGETTLGVVPVQDGAAYLPISTLAPGTHTINVDYSGNGVFNSRYGPPIIQVVN